MPVVVVALAAGSFAAGASAFAAASTLAGMVTAGATMAGAALTMVGTVTGNAKLTKIGAIVGIVGGLGTAALNMAADAGAAAGAAGAADSATAATGTADALGNSAEAAANAVETAPVDLGSVGSTAGASASGTADVGGGLLSDAAKATTAAAPTTAAPASGGLLNAAAPPAAAPTSVATSDVLGSGNAAAQAGQNAVDSSSTVVGQSNNINAFKTASPWQQLTQGTGSTSGDYLGQMESSGIGSTAAPLATDPGVIGTLAKYGNDVQNWAKANPLLAKAALDGTSAFVKGIAPTEQEKTMMAYYKAQSDAIARRARWGSGHV